MELRFPAESVYQSLCFDFHHPRCLNFSKCYSVFPHTCRIHCLGRIERNNTYVLLVLIFIPAWSHAAENACLRPCCEDVSGTKLSAKVKGSLAVSNSDILVDSSVTVYPMYIDQGTPHILGEGYISYCIRVRGPDIFRKVIVLNWRPRYRLSRGVVTVHTLVGVQHPRWADAI